IEGGRVRAHNACSDVASFARRCFMRRILLTVALTLWASHADASILFTPDSFTLEVRAVFTDNNTDRFCWRCGDTNPSNDLQAVLQSATPFSESWTDFVAYSAG